MRKALPTGASLFGLFNCRDLHENNVLVTERVYPIETNPEANKPVLIDLGRGAVTGSLSQRLSVENETEGRGIIQDVDAYGALIWELTKRWMSATHRSTVPAALVDIVAKCMSRNENERPNMRSVIRMLESLGNAFIYNHFVPESSKSEAEELVTAKARLEQSPAAIGRPIPSAPSYRGRNLKMSIETIDEVNVEW